jgi:hypothetical protein
VEAEKLWVYIKKGLSKKGAGTTMIVHIQKIFGGFLLYIEVVVPDTLVFGQPRPFAK